MNRFLEDGVGVSITQNTITQNKLVVTDATQTLTNKTLTTPKLGSGGSIVDVNGNEIIEVSTTVAGAVNNIKVTNAPTTGAPVIEAVGGDANVTLNIKGKGTGGVQILAGTLVSAVFGVVASAVNYFGFTANSTGGAPTISTYGADANVGMDLASKGTGSLRLLVGTFITAVFNSVSSAVNYFTFTGSATGVAPSISATGNDGNIGLEVVTKGVGVFKENGNAVVGVPLSANAYRTAVTAQSVTKGDLIKLVNNTWYKANGIYSFDVYHGESQLLSAVFSSSIGKPIMNTGNDNIIALVRSGGVSLVTYSQITKKYTNGTTSAIMDLSVSVVDYGLSKNPTSNKYIAWKTTGTSFVYQTFDFDGTAVSNSSAITTVALNAHSASVKWLGANYIAVMTTSTTSSTASCNFIGIYSSGSTVSHSTSVMLATNAAYTIPIVTVVSSTRAIVYFTRSNNHYSSVIDFSGTTPTLTKGNLLTITSSAGFIGVVIHTYYNATKTMFVLIHTLGIHLLSVTGTTMAVSSISSAYIGDTTNPFNALSDSIIIQQQSRGIINVFEIYDDKYIQLSSIRIVNSPSDIEYDEYKLLSDNTIVGFGKSGSFDAVYTILNKSLDYDSVATSTVGVGVSITELYRGGVC